MLVLDGIVILILSILAIIIKYGGLQPYYRGFYCYDSSIKYPYKVSVSKNHKVQYKIIFSPAPSAVSWPCLSAQLFLFCRWSSWRLSSISRETVPCQVWGQTYTTLSKYFLLGQSLQGYVLKHFMFQLQFNIYLSFQLLTSVGKLTIGRLRPHFLEVCKIDLVLNPAICGTPEVLK